MIPSLIAVIYFRQNAGEPPQPHHLHQQPQREDQEGGPQEVAVRDLLPVRPDPGDCCAEDAEDAGAGLRDLQGDQ